MRVLIIAHRTELITQAVGHAKRAGLTAGIEMGTQHCPRGTDVVVSTVQTLNSTRKCDWCVGAGGDCDQCKGSGKVYRMTKLNPLDFGALIIDESHHASATSYRRIIKHFTSGNPDLRVLGVTATPKRADGVGLHNVFDSVAYEMDLLTGINEGWLCPIRQRFVECEHLDISGVGTKAGGDLADGDLSRAFLELTADEEQTLHEIVYPTLKEANGQQVLFFAPGVEPAKHFTASFNRHGATAELIVGSTDKDERKRIVERYKNKETQVLVNCMVATEGFDAPDTAIVANARPTKSESLYLQIIGRGTRPLPGTVDGPDTAELRRAAIAASDKPYCTVLDFVGNSGRHKLVSVADCLAGETVEADVSLAVQMARESNEAVDMQELFEKAKQAREEKEKRAEERRKQRLETRTYAESGEYSAHDVDLFGGNQFDPFTDYQPTRDMASQKQVNLLMKLGVSVETATTYSKRQAGAVITKLKNGTGKDYIVTFGKHAGKKLSEIPSGYVRWMKENLNRPELQEQIAMMEGAKQQVEARMAKRHGAATEEVPF